MKALISGAAALAGLSLCGFAMLDAKPAKKAAPTYAGEVAAILNKNCVSCHRPDQVAPFSLIGYKSAKNKAGMIAAVGESRQMPPWKAVHGYGDFWGERRLSDEDIQTLKDWSAAGAPEGDASKTPPTPAFHPGWVLGQPDLVLTPEKSFHVEAEGDDVYRNFVIKNFDSDKPTFVSGMDVKPGNRKVVHHVIIFVDGLNQSPKVEAATKDGQPGYTSFGGPGFLPTGSLGGWAPGVDPVLMAPGMAFVIPPHAKLVLQVHYHKTGKPEDDKTEIGLYTSKYPVTKKMDLLWFVNTGLHIPAGEAHQKVTMSRKIGANVTMYAVMPHMHLLGKSMKAWVTMPDGKDVPLVLIDDWDFRWQMSYALKQPLHIPKGSVLHAEAFYDNSAANPRNPSNPPRNITWGEQTTDEMCLLVAAYTVDGAKAPDGQGEFIKSRK